MKSQGRKSSFVGLQMATTHEYFYAALISIETPLMSFHFSSTMTNDHGSDVAHNDSTIASE